MPSGQGPLLQSSAPLLFPQGVAYAGKQSGSGGRQLSQGTATDPSAKESMTPGVLPQQMPTFVFPQSIILSGMALLYFRIS